MSEKKNMLSFLGLDLSEEELEERNKKRFESTKENPENMSYWFPPLLESNKEGKSVIQLPETKVIQLEYETWNWLTSDKYTEEKVKEFNDLLVKELGEFLTDKTLFMKTGVFSNKFEFHQTVINDHSKIGRQFLDMYYTSMIYGANNTSEAVFREMIEDTEDRGRIYGGMPLHTEFRVFYDFDTKEVVGISNYWHPEVMERGISEEDLSVYNTERERLITEFDSLKESVAEEVSLFLQDCEGLKGKWSVDIMKNEEELWLIDMARMERSALVDKMETLGAD